MNRSCASRLSKPAAILLVVLLTAVPGCAQNAPKRITVDGLNAALSDRQPIVVDVRDTGDWDKSDQKIKGAIRLNPRNFDPANLPIAKNALLVLY